MLDMNIILYKHASKHELVLDDKIRTVALGAMLEYAARVVERRQESENKAINLEAIHLFPALWKGQWKLFLRKRAFLKAKKTAQERANIENRPVHVLRLTDITYSVQSTREVRDMRKAGAYKDKHTSIKVYEMADATLYPQKK